MKIFHSANASLAQGAIDNVNETGVRGWCATSSCVCISVNGSEFFNAFCWRERPDVQTSLGIDTTVGFNAPLRLLPGDIVEVTSGGQPLPGSPQRVGANAWLAAPSNHHTAFAPLASLLERTGASHFKPFFKRNAELTAVAVRGDDFPDTLVKLAATPAHIQDVSAFYEQVITPLGLPAPELLPPSSTWGFEPCLSYEYIDGVSVSGAVLLSESVRRQVIDVLGQLHSHSIPTLRRVNQQQAYLVDLQRLVLRQALLTYDVRHILFMLKLRRCVKHLPCVLSHGDLHAGNVIVTEKSDTVCVSDKHGSAKDRKHAVLIDWDRWGMLPIGYDEACFLRGLPFAQALSYLPHHVDLRLGFAVFSYWLGLVEHVKFRFTERAKEIARYVEGSL